MENIEESRVSQVYDFIKPISFASNRLAAFTLKKSVIRETLFV